MAAQKRDLVDLVARGERGNDFLGTAIFLGLRAMDPYLQRHLLLNSPLPQLASKLGLSQPGLPPTGGLPLAGTGMTPYQCLIWAFSVGSAAKHYFWIAFTGRETVHSLPAVAVGLFNSVFNTLNTLAYNAAAENPAYFPPWSIYIGTALYVTGILTETISEVQRKSFKDNPKNDGKVYTGGLFSLLRHPSYFGYTLWRTGYALASGGPLWGTAVAAFFLYDFKNRAVPILDEYMSKKYGEQWAKYRRDVPFALLPGVF